MAVPITSNSSSSLVAINVAAQTPIKLMPTNYCAWRMQFQIVLIGYNLIGYVDGSLPYPPTHLSASNGFEGSTINPTHLAWIRQDQLILNAIVDSLSPDLVSFIITAKSSRQAWELLLNTYAKPSRGRIMQLRSTLDQMTKGTHTVTEFMQSVKACSDELALLNASCDINELTFKILNGLGDEYQGFSDAIKARDNTIFFEELHEKLMECEAQLFNNSSRLSIPTMANHAAKQQSRSSSSDHRPNQHGRPSNISRQNSTTPHKPRPYKGFC